MVDWVTFSVEAVGVLIFFIWIIVPIGEFKSIYRHLASQKKLHRGYYYAGHSKFVIIFVPLCR
jgi:hypothetical protein